MPAVLSIACRCGRTHSAPCPTLADIAVAQQQFVGWTYDDHGRARCPDCSAALAVERVEPSPMFDLFEERA